MPKTRKLSDLSPGDVARVVRISGKGPLLRRLMDMGFVKGEIVKVVRKAPLGDPIEFEVKGYNISLRKEEADHVLVELVGE